MAGRVRELEELPSGLVLDGELIALKGDHPWFPSVCDRILHGRDIPVVYVVFDLLHDSEGTLLKRRTRSDGSGSTR